MKKISTFKIVGNSFSFIKNNFATYFSISVLPIFITTLFNLLNENIKIPYIIILIAYLILSYVYIRLAINIHNFVILEKMPESYFENMWNKTIKWFWIYAIIIGTPWTLFSIFLPLFILIPMFTILIKFLIIAFIVLFLFWFVTVRFSLIFPSVAVGDNVSFFAFGKTTKGARLTIIFQFIIILLTVLIISIPHTGIYNTIYYGDAFFIFFNTIAVQFALVLMITCLSFTYKQWKEIQSKNYLPCEELLEILKPAYVPCKNFDGICKDKIIGWNPSTGNVPRGYCGAFGDIKDVKLVLVVAEPSNPKDDEKYTSSNDNDYVFQVSKYVFDCYNDNRSPMHKNVRYIINKCFPDITSFEEQLKKVWITETVLCSANQSTGKIDGECAKACVSTYLEKQLELLSHAYVILLGGKSHQRVGYFFETKNNVSYANAVGLPGANTKESKESWERAIKDFHEFS
jgi:hypothetical protein|tara:strand:- start:80 stop:1453 length:1374 start_codon:yes stop_codon:yes gene_type:complete